MLRRLRLSCGLHATKHIDAGGNLHWGGLGLRRKEVTVRGLAFLEGPVAQAVGQSSTAVHSRAVLVRGHVHILRLQAQVQLGHVFAKPVKARVVAEVSFFAVQVARTDLGQVFAAGV